MSTPCVRIEEAAGLEGMAYSAYKKRLQRENVPLVPDPEDGRRKLVPLKALSSTAMSKYLQSQATASEVTLAPHSKSLTPVLLFQPLSESEDKLRAAAPPIAKHLSPYIDRWSQILGQTRNGTWKKYQGQLYGGVAIRNASDFIRGIAHLEGIAPSTIYSKLKTWREVEHDSSVPVEQKHSELWKRILPQSRPGLSGHSFFADPENVWAREQLHGFYLNQAKLSVKRAHELLCLEIDAKQRVHELGHLYEKPTLKQCRTALEKVDRPTLTLAREGEKAFDDRCGKYISRRPPARANDIWVTDQRLCNVRLRDGGNKLGRVWVINFLDVTSWRWLGCAFVPLLNSDGVMAAAAFSLERGGVPRAIHMDLGKEFIGKRFTGKPFSVHGKVLFRDAVGLWERLKVQVLRAIGRNPQSKIIERWHQMLDAFDHEQPGWCGSNTDERPEKLDQEEAAHEVWLEKGLGCSPLLSIPEYINRFMDFCERQWNGEHRGRGKYLQGMTPNEAWNTRLPEAGLRTLTREQVDFYTSDHHVLKVARGGQVNLTFYGQTIEYEAPELFTLQGEEVEVIVSRRSIRHVTVIFPGGKGSCVAKAKPLHDWLPEDREDLRAAIRCKAAMRRTIKKGIQAQRALASGASPAQLAGPEAGMRFISGNEWMMRKSFPLKTETSEAIANEALEMEEGS